MYWGILKEQIKMYFIFLQFIYCIKKKSSDGVYLAKQYRVLNIAL